MTSRQADKLIREGSVVRITDKYGDSGTVQFIKREGRTVYGSKGEAFTCSDIVSFTKC